MSDIKLSIITATYNAAEHLPRLIESLLAQTDQDFEWVVADGGSTDGTLELLEQARPKFKRLIVDSRPDFGIYDALNRAIKLASGDYYVVLGADDAFFSDAVRNYKLACLQTKTDLVTARMFHQGKIVCRGAAQKEWLHGMSSHISGHAVGVAIRRVVHEKWGWYSNKFPIAADQLFVMSAVKGGATVSEASFIAGQFSAFGLSQADLLGAVTELFRIQVLLGRSLVVQTFILLFRIIKNFKALGYARKSQ